MGWPDMGSVRSESGTGIGTNNSNDITGSLIIYSVALSKSRKGLFPSDFPSS